MLVTEGYVKGKCGCMPLEHTSLGFDQPQLGVQLELIFILLVRAECVRCPWLQAETKVATILGIFLFLLFFGVPLFKAPEGVVVGFHNFA